MLHSVIARETPKGAVVDNTTPTARPTISESPKAVVLARATPTGLPRFEPTPSGTLVVSET